MQSPQDFTNDPAQNALNPDQSQNATDDMARDPVCGMMVDKRSAQNTFAPPIGVAMETLYFCSAACKTTFESDPASFGFPNL